MAKLQFDASGVDMTKDAFAPLPAGDYEVAATATDIRATKAGNGSYLWIEFTVTKGKFTGRKLFEQINLQNPNTTAVEIAQRTLAGLLAAMGKTKMDDTDELLHRPVIAVVALDKKDATRNRVNRYKAVPTYAPAAPTAAAPAAPPAPAPAGGAAAGIPSAW